MDPKVSVTMSRECSTIFSSVNTSQVGRGMSRGRNEHSVESEMEVIRKGSIYWHYCSKFFFLKKRRETVVPVPLLLVPVPPKLKRVVAFWYRYHT